MFTTKGLVKYRKIVYTFDYEDGDNPKEYIRKEKESHPDGRVTDFKDNGKTCTFAIEFETRRVL